MRHRESSSEDTSSKPNMTLGMFIKRRRETLKLSQEQLAERMSTSTYYVRQTEISRLELDKVSLPRRHRLIALGQALDVPLGELLWLTRWNSFHIHGASGGEDCYESPLTTTSCPDSLANGAGDDMLLGEHTIDPVQRWQHVTSADLMVAPGTHHVDMGSAPHVGD